MEADWNDEAVRAVETDGRDAPSNFKYFASKVLAERGTNKQTLSSSRSDAEWSFCNRCLGFLREE